MGKFNTYDNIPIRYATWEAKTTSNKGTICLFTGRGEFIEKYYQVIEKLISRGFNVAMMDWRGQGLSHRRLVDPFKGHVSSFQNYQKDLQHFMTEIVLPDCRPPYFALAHSMGGAILLNHAKQHANWFERIILTAPMLRLASSKFMSHKMIDKASKLLYALGQARQYVPGGQPDYFTKMAFKDNPLTSDRGQFLLQKDWLKMHPDLGIGHPTVGWVTEAMKLMNQFPEPQFAVDVHVPVLIMVAGQDQVIHSPALMEMGSRLRAGKAILIPESKHEILMETNHIREQFWAAFDAFIPGTTVY